MANTLYNVGDHEIRRRAFLNAQHQIAARIRLFVNLPIDKLDRLSLQAELRELGTDRLNME